MKEREYFKCLLTTEYFHIILMISYIYNELFSQEQFSEITSDIYIYMATCILLYNIPR